MTNSFQVRIVIFLKGGRAPLFLLNKLGEKSQATIIIGKLVNKSLSNTSWRIIFGKKSHLSIFKAHSNVTVFP